MDSDRPVSEAAADGQARAKAGPSKMAETAALIRVRESGLPEDERICYDPYAIRFVSQELLAMVRQHPEQFRAEMEKHDRLMPGLANSLVARVRFFDDIVTAAIAGGLEQMVILGAGFDTRPYRIGGLRSVRVFEVDQQETVTVKTGKIKEIFGSLPDHVAYVPVDLEADSLGRRLGQNGYDRSKKTLFVMEGLIYYLPPEAVDGLLAFIVRNSGRGSAVLFDYGRVLDRPASAGDAGGMDFARRQGEPIKSGISEPIETFLGHRGFSIIRNLDSAEYKELYFRGKNSGRAVYDRSSFVYAAVK